MAVESGTNLPLAFLGEAVQVTAVSGRIYQIGALTASPSTVSEQVFAAPSQASSMRWTEPGSPRRSTPATRSPNCMRHLITSIGCLRVRIAGFVVVAVYGSAYLSIRIQCRRSSCVGELFDEQSESVGVVARA